VSSGLLGFLSFTYLSGRNALAVANAVWTNLTANSINRRDMMRSMETMRQHAIELHEKDLHAVQLMEKRLDISDRRLPESEEWKAAAEKVSMRQYQRCLDTLEGLIVAQMFELMKMNMSQTGVSVFIVYCTHCLCCTVRL
jgi:hypothetical protein